MIEFSDEFKSISVVICTYNRAIILERCIESLKMQTYPNFEIIVVNGPSTDETDKVLEKYKEIRTVNERKLNGLSFARNLGIKEAKGEIIVFIDDDSVADKNWIKYLVEGYTDESIGGVGGIVLNMVDNSNQFKNGYISRAGIPSFINEKDLDYNDPKGNFFNYIMGTNSSFKKNLLNEIGLFDEKIKYYLDEADVCVRVIRSGYKIKHVTNAIVFHEMAEGHNRKSPGDINWYEIMKNSIYFTMKYFKGDFSSYTTRPAKSMVRWMKHASYLYLKGDISILKFFMIFIDLIKGTITGFKEGFYSNKLNMDK